MSSFVRVLVCACVCARACVCGCLPGCQCFIFLHYFLVCPSPPSFFSSFQPFYFLLSILGLSSCINMRNLVYVCACMSMYVCLCVIACMRACVQNNKPHHSPHFLSFDSSVVKEYIHTIHTNFILYHLFF